MGAHNPFDYDKNVGGPGGGIRRLLFVKHSKEQDGTGHFREFGHMPVGVVGDDKLPKGKIAGPTSFCGLQQSSASPGIDPGSTCLAFGGGVLGNELTILGTAPDHSTDNLTHHKDTKDGDKFLTHEHSEHESRKYGWPTTIDEKAKCQTTEQALKYAQCNRQSKMTAEPHKKFQQDATNPFGDKKAKYT